MRKSEKKRNLFRFFAKNTFFCLFRFKLKGEKKAKLVKQKRLKSKKIM